MSWLRKNARVLILITAALGSAPFLPGWAQAIFSAGSQFLESSNTP